VWDCFPSMWIVHMTSIMVAHVIDSMQILLGENL
jgi:hypothetical protein